ncbi:MAG: DoxX family protein [Planctomycetes bacterium]|nr:DoxX family protein [Planctomycetota bacterium]
MTNETTSTSASIGLLILRVGIGCYMLTHGWGKAHVLFNGNAEQFGDPLGMGKTLSLVLAVGAEAGCAVLVALGAATRLAALPIAFTMGVAAFVVHADDPWTMSGGASKEPALLYLIPSLALVFTGGGRFSVDAWLRARKQRS